MFQKCKSGIRNQFPVPYLLYLGSYWFLVFSTSSTCRHKMILKIQRYLSAYNEYCEVSVERAYINMKLRIGNRESGTSNRELILCSLFE